MNKNLLRVLRIFLIIVFILLAVIHGFLLYFGISNVIGGILFILLTGIAVFYIAKKTAGILSIKRAVKTNIRLLLITIFLLWAGVELFLRFGISKYANYSEKNGLFLYISPYTVKETLWYSPWQKNVHVYKPYHSKIINLKEYKYKLETNSEGLRDGEFSTFKPVDEYRIIGLGDSFTEGRGASADSTWVKHLKRILQQDSGKQKITAINAGISGSDPFFEYALLKERLLKYQPDLVIIAINNSDIYDIIIRGGIERFQEEGCIKYRSGPKWEWLYATSYIFRHIIHDIFEYDRMFLQHHEKAIETKQALAQIYSCILKFDELAKENGFDLLIVFHPMEYEVLEKEYAFGDLLTQISSETNIMVLDLLDYYINEEKLSSENSSEYYWKTDRHHNSKGYRIFAKGVGKKLLNLYLTEHTQ
ncbi:MAG: SGNH/GDSL hydrolase family protein [Bacteroidota bacterium]